MCVAVGAHTKPVFQATLHPTIPSSIRRVASKANISGSCRINRRGNKTTDFISCIPAHCGHKYGPNELSYCTHRPMRQLTHCGHKYKPNEMSEVVLIYHHHHHHHHHHHLYQIVKAPTDEIQRFTLDINKHFTIILDKYRGTGPVYNV